MSAGARTAAGFTLVELMIALVVLAVLAAISVPGYRAYAQRAHRVEAMRALAQVQTAQEKYFIDQHRYASALEAAPPAGLGLQALSETGLYAIALEVAEDGSAYQAVATPVATASQHDDRECERFSIDDRGRRQALSGETDTTRKCWR